MAPVDPLLLLAQRVAAEAEALGVETAIIGAMALAYHGYIRATLDVDLGACTSLALKLRPLADRLRQQGLYVVLNEPDETDPLDGVLQVRESEDSEKVEIVNIRAVKLGRAAVDRAQVAGDGFRYVRLPELIALKLYAGGRKSRRDIEEVLAANPDASLEDIRKVCAELDLERELDEALSSS